MVLAVRNMASTIEAQLAALRRQDFTGRWELIFVDNGSTDGTAGIAERWRPCLPLRFVHATRRFECGYAKNAGAAAAAAPLLAFCDGDDEVAPDWLRAIVRALRNAAIVTGRLDAQGLNAPAAARALEGRLPSGPAWLPIPQGGGGNFGIRRSVFRAVGGLPEPYGRGNDTAFFWLAQLAGHEVVPAPEAVVHYRLKGDSHWAMFQRFYRQGRTSVRHYKRFRVHGMPRSPARDVVYDWATIPIRWLHGDTYRAAQQAGWRLGRLISSARSGVLCL